MLKFKSSMWQEMVDPNKTRLCLCSVFQLQYILGSTPNEANNSFACYNGNYLFCQRKKTKTKHYNDKKIKNDLS